MAASENMKSLMKKKDDIEKEMQELTDVLESQKGVGMDGPLVDTEGYPRADIDVYSVRHARHQIACLQTDHTMLMKEIEEELYRIHAELREKQSGDDTPMEVTPASASSKPVVPFLKVDRVDSGSPASSAGIEVGDEVVEFGSVTAENFTSLQQIGGVVQHSIGRPVRVKVLRNNQTRVLSITPGPWSGRGNLGCNIVSIKR
ncbi:hypothetical protein BaRGS_00011603 [Batillaria attramentaria]|uniref:26S proteasome non-ATPase regulatory subunit 9 n=1 Tax=Batillaria attramentaria TaxID=370345 RepID=A0ABD0LCT2_9CAEN